MFITRKGCKMRERTIVEALRHGELVSPSSKSALVELRSRDDFTWAILLLQAKPTVRLAFDVTSMALTPRIVQHAVKKPSATRMLGPITPPATGLGSSIPIETCLKIHVTASQDVHGNSHDLRSWNEVSSLLCSSRQ